MDDSLAHGFGREDIRVFAAESSEHVRRMEIELSPLLQHRYARSRDSRQLVQHVHDILSEHALDYACKRDKKKRIRAAHWLLLDRTSNDEVISIFIARLTYSRDGRFSFVPTPILTLDAHTLARLHQRMNFTNRSILIETLRQTALLAIGFNVTARVLKLSQFGILASHGLVVGEVGTRTLDARSFYTSLEAGKWREYHRVIKDWNDALEVVDRKASWLLLDRTQILGDFLLLCEPFNQPRFSWLKQKYKKGRDIAGETFDLARQQMNNH